MWSRTVGIVEVKVYSLTGNAYVKCRLFIRHGDNIELQIAGEDQANPKEAIEDALRYLVLSGLFWYDNLEACYDDVKRLIADDYIEKNSKQEE